MLKNKITRKPTKSIRIGNQIIGSDHPIAVQSMIMADPKKLETSISEIHTLEKAGCDMVRVAVPSRESAMQLRKLKENTRLPLIADIHFDPELALISIQQGVDKIRLNPSNIRNPLKIREVVACARDANIPIRVGANEGSLKVSDTSSSTLLDALFDAIRREVDLLEKFNFDNIVLSAKTSNIERTIAINRMLSNSYSYPLHIGLTEAGLPAQGIVKTCLALTPLLLEGMGDTLRFSLAGHLQEEVFAARSLLRYLDLEPGVEVIACPTCGRSRWKVAQAAERIQEAVSHLKIKATIAVMGCEVNGPGEARHADFGLAGTGEKVLLFEKGQRIALGDENAMMEALLKKLSTWSQSG